MALCELTRFPSIPVKVTLDEYIELSKDYSSPQSKNFINGILDKIVVEYKRDNKIQKAGRGLVE
jgi:N utilization substance protein B